MSYQVRSSVGRCVALACLVVFVSASVAAAAPTVTITSPSAEATVSRSASPTLAVAGSATFDPPVASTRQFFLRQDACGTDSNNPHLSVRQGRDGGNGCGYVTQPANEVLHTLGEALTWSYTSADGVPFTLDTAGRLTGTIVVTSGFKTAVGQATTEVTVTGVSGTRTLTLGTVSKTYLVTPTQASYEIPLDVDVDDAVGQAALSSLTVDVVMRGVAVPIHGYVELNGKSFLTVPIRDAGTVEVSSSPTFPPTTTVQASLGQAGGWTAKIPTPAAGTQTIYARARQGATTVDAQPVTITVTP
jgi:hypothetical protein